MRNHLILIGFTLAICNPWITFVSQVFWNIPSLWWQLYIVHLSSCYWFDRKCETVTCRDGIFFLSFFLSFFVSFFPSFFLYFFFKCGSPGLADSQTRWLLPLASSPGQALRRGILKCVLFWDFWPKEGKQNNQAVWIFSSLWIFLLNNAIILHVKPGSSLATGYWFTRVIGMLNKRFLACNIYVGAKLFLMH